MRDLRVMVLMLFAAWPVAGGAADESAGVANASIQAFIQICIVQAPSFLGSAEAAKAFGITELFESDGEKTGMTADTALTVQIRENRSCTVTTDVQKDRKLTQQLLEAVARQVGSKPARRVPAEVVLGGERFVLTHDRNGGEAFVLVKAK